MLESLRKLVLLHYTSQCWTGLQQKSSMNTCQQKKSNYNFDSESLLQFPAMGNASDQRFSRTGGWSRTAGEQTGLCFIAFVNLGHHRLWISTHSQREHVIFMCTENCCAYKVFARLCSCELKIKKKNGLSSPRQEFAGSGVILTLKWVSK